MSNATKFSADTRGRASYPRSQAEPGNEIPEALPRLPLRTIITTNKSNDLMFSTKEQISIHFSFSFDLNLTPILKLILIL